MYNSKSDCKKASYRTLGKNAYKIRKMRIKNDQCEQCDIQSGQKGTL